MTTKIVKPIQPLIIAHRGASGLVSHDNTIESFQKAIELRVEMAELDVRRTRDKKMVVFHDSEIQGRPLRTLTFQELNHLAEIEGFQAPLLEEVLEHCQGKIKLDIELKEVGYEIQVVDMVRRYLPFEQYIMKSFYDTSVYQIKLYEHKITVGLLLGQATPPNVIRTRLSELFPEYRLLKSHADFVSPHYRLAVGGFIHRMKLMKKPVYVWTVNDKSLMRKLFKRGVKGIITDRPDLALEAFEVNFTS